MRNFIKNHTPKWWDGWCWFALAMLVWSIGWAVFGSIPMARGFHTGMAIYWVGVILHRGIVWLDSDLLRTYRELNRLDNKIIARQRETIALKNETIAVQNDYINHLQKQRTAR